MSKGAKRIGVFGFDGVNAVDVVGPIEVFASAGRADVARKESRGLYQTYVIGMTDEPFTAESGVRFVPDCRLANAPAVDTLIVPGGWGLREPATNAAVSAWLRIHAPRARRVASVCTGVYGLAPTGLLDGRRVTTHWRFAEDVARRFPRLTVDAKALFIKDGRYYTSGGITAGIDLALALVEDDLGPHIALKVARELVVYLKRPGGQEQYSEPLRFQVQSADRFFGSHRLDRRSSRSRPVGGCTRAASPLEPATFQPAICRNVRMHSGAVRRERATERGARTFGDLGKCCRQRRCVGWLP